MSAVVDVWGNSLKAIRARNAETLSVSVDVTASVVEAFLEGGDTVEVDALDLYEAIFRDQKAKIESLENLNGTYKARAKNHSLACADYESRIAILTSARDELAAALEEQGQTGFSNAGSVELRQLLADEMAKNKKLAFELERSQEDAATLINDLKSKNALYENRLETLSKDIEVLTGEKLAYQAEVEAAKSANKILENKILTADGHAKEAAKASGKQLRELQVKSDKLARALDLANKEIAKNKASRAENHKCNLEAIEAMKTAKKTMSDMEAEIAELRIVRRYLVMMMDCALHDNFFESESGYCNVLTYNTNEFSSPEDDFAFDETYPVGFWINKNGFACVLGVSHADENGNRAVVMPKNEKISKRALDAICPPKSDLKPILEKLMEFDAAACRESFSRSRDKISQLAIYAEHEENLLQENKNLVAITKRVVAGGRTAVPSRTGHSVKRKAKPRR